MVIWGWAGVWGGSLLFESPRNALLNHSREGRKRGENWRVGRRDKEGEEGERKGGEKREERGEEGGIANEFPRVWHCGSCVAPG